MKLQFAVDHNYKGEPLKSGDVRDVDVLDGRELILLGIARVAPESTTEAKGKPKASEKKEA